MTAPRPGHGADGAKVELADVVRRFADPLRRTRRLSRTAHQVLGAIARCRTPALGGQRYDCPRCARTHYAYHSCRNRHCPKCQQMTKAQWLAARAAELLPVAYFHFVFTLPHELNAPLRADPRRVLGLLFSAASRTLLEFGQQHLHGRVGFTMVLHTWDRQLNLHPHVHVMMPAGALADDGQRWIAMDRKFAFPVRALSQVFRGKFMEQARRWLDDPARVEALYGKAWVVYAQPPFGGPRHLLGYLGRYTHRVGISNDRIQAIDGERVVFTYRDRRDGDRLKPMALDGVEFLRRFLLHVLPCGFMRVRHYGLLANRCKKQTLTRCRQLLEPAGEDHDPAPLPSTADAAPPPGDDPTVRCPVCGVVMRVTRLAPMPRPRPQQRFQPARSPPPSRWALTP